VVVVSPVVVFRTPVVVAPPVVVVAPPVIVHLPVVVRRPIVVAPPVVVTPRVVEPRRRIIRAFPQAMESGGALRSVSRGSSAPLLTTSPPALAQPPTGAPGARPIGEGDRPRGWVKLQAPWGGPAGLRSTGPAAVNPRARWAVPGGGSVGHAAPVVRSGSAWAAAPAPGLPVQVGAPTLRAPVQIAAPPVVARGAGHGPARRSLLR
jgi:hypothetical protein